MGACEAHAISDSSKKSFKKKKESNWIIDKKK